MTMEGPRTIIIHIISQVIINVPGTISRHFTHLIFLITWRKVGGIMLTCQESKAQ